ncbi:MAG TPA: transporter substrate-binding domain-containing protein [Desulfobacteraceae bacterium]|nr:transporter substrate-binding domain-containing protein [Deltaproteobacteria bacterium]RLB98165.1 MAG: hypothetical protein DRH76_03235 [Deltaproteobacteria bacterium]HDI59453.1 transporter substrate-binding domain-containing protein [Desulfobacteraceae bacterium]
MNLLRYIAFLLAALLLQPFSAFGVDEPALRIGIKPTSPPFTFLDSHDGRMRARGLNVDLGLLLGKLMHREVKFVPVADLRQRRQWLRDNRIDLILFDSAAFKHIPEFSYIPLGLCLRRRLFVNERCRDVVCLKDLQQKRVVMVTGDDVWKRDVIIGQAETLIVVASPEEALALLDDGAVDVYIAPSERVAEAYIAKHEFQHVRKVGVVQEEMPAALVVRQADVELQHQLSQAMAKIKDSAALDLLKEKWFGVSYAPTLWARHGRNILLAATGGLGLLLFVLIWNQQLKAKVRSVTRDLEASERNFRTLIESSPDMIFVVGEDGALRHANPLARENLPPGEAESRHLLDVVAPEERDNCRIFIKNVLENGFASAEMVFVTPNGGKLEVDVAATRVRDYPSGDVCACLFARDVTERNRIEAELAQTDRMITIGRMAAGVAHEINNPLGIVLANVELILSRRLPLEQSEEFLDAIRRNAIRAGNITRDLLSVARPQAPHMAEIDLYQTVEKTLSMLRPQTKGITLVHTPPKNPPLIRADEGMLQQVIVNVVLNAKTALKDSPDPKLELRYCCPEKSEIIRLCAEDNGKGIARRRLNDIFEPFVTTGHTENFGLGLFISRRIVERHGGLMYAESEENKGTLMVIELPRHGPVPNDAESELDTI